MLRILSVGRLDWRTGLEHGLVSARALVERGIPFHWTIVGDGPYLVALQWAVRDLQLGDRVTITDAISDRNLHRLIEDSDVLFDPSVCQGPSNPLYEAPVEGLPLVVTDVADMPEDLCNRVRVFVVSPRDWRAMAAALEQLAVSPELQPTVAVADKQPVTRDNG